MSVPVAISGAQVLTDEVVHERIHADREVRLRRQTLRVGGEAENPPLAIERTTLPEGPRRPPVILVHGFAQNRYTWRLSKRSLSGHLAEAGYDVLNLELRGHGNSRAYGSGNARNFGEYVSDLVRVIEGCERPPFVIGHSLGGGVGVGAVTEAKVAGLVHIAGVFGFASQNRVIRTAARASVKAADALRLRGLRMSTGPAGRLVGRLYGLADATGYGFPLSGWAPGSIEQDLVEERLELGMDWTSAEVWLQMCRWALGEPFEYADAFRENRTPLLVIAGSADPLLHPHDARRCYDGSGSPDRTFIVFDPFEHEVHWGHLDLLIGRRAPDIVWPQILGWLNERSGA